MVKSIKDLNKKDLEGKKVLVRVDFNVPQDSDLNITDDSRIVAAIPTIKYLIENQAKVILVSHLGRPKGKFNEKMRLKPIAKRLSEILHQEVLALDEAIGDKVKTAIAQMKNGQVALLENIRFYPGEETNDAEFAKELASLAELYVNDAFGTAHRAHASTEGVTAYLSPAVAGFLMIKEVEMLGSKLNEPERPFTAIIGGSKVSSKIAVLKNLVQKVDTLIVGGGMAFTFIKAQGGQIGKSICENDQLDTAREIINLADQFDTALILPDDTIITPAVNANGEAINIFDSYKTTDKLETSVCASNQISDKFQGMDIGPVTREKYAKLISQSKTVIWNGPVGVFEFDSLEEGTKAVANALVELTKKGGTTIIGGGDSVAALEKFGIAKEKLTHVSTGGGASLEFLEGQVLPGLACLDGYDADSSDNANSSLKKSFAEELKKVSI
ncbi:MAG: phosphoglycerate kinase [Candidatus Caenarcaniphilales bacterium]|jgi:triosephosphate isomerase|nr:phosphoglycerate kinase [Candidatus Caenarcaniphilales bacterium]